jgi:hypothetical protein
MVGKRVFNLVNIFFPKMRYAIRCVVNFYSAGVETQIVCRRKVGPTRLVVLS